MEEAQPEDKQFMERRALMRVALWLTAATPLAPCTYQTDLLAQYLRGALTIDQVLALVEDRARETQAQDMPE